MKTREIPIVILLDLSIDNEITEASVIEQIPGQPDSPIILRATQYDVPRSRSGCPDRPADWTRCMYALGHLADDVKRQADAKRTVGTQVRFWIAGNAGLPVFYLFGHLMSRWGGAITLVHNESNGPMRRLVLEPAAGDLFKIVRKGLTGGTGAVSVQVSSRKRLDPATIDAYQAVEGITFTSDITAHTDEDMTEANFGSGVRQLEELALSLPTRTIAVLMRIPWPLAFAFGRAINPRTVGTVLIPSFDMTGGGRGYQPAVRLPLDRVEAEPHPHTLLFVAANPRDGRFLELKPERDCIAQEIAAARGGEQRIRFESDVNTDPDALIDQLHRHQPAIVHFSGHGNDYGVAVERADGNQTLASFGALANALKRESPGTVLAVVSSCYSEAGVARLLQSVRCVVSMSDLVDDESARGFAKTFYRAIALNRTFASAFQDACERLEMKHLPDADVPRIAFASDADRDTLSLCSLACPPVR